MDINEITARLRQIGCEITRTQVNGQGRHVHLVQPWNVAMFQENLTAILEGRATLADVIEANRGADLADPWPVA